MWTKLSLVPVAEQQTAAGDYVVSDDDIPGMLKDWVREYYAAFSGNYELRVQLLTDLTTMPIEDASVEWPQNLSPYRTVATITLPVQDSFSNERRVYAEDVMFWRP